MNHIAPTCRPTPGPWQWGAFPNDGCTTCYLETTRDHFPIIQGDMTCDNMADLPLIAAAPELYISLRMVYKDWLENPGPGLPADLVERVENALRLVDGPK